MKEIDELKKQNVYEKLQHARVMLQEKNKKKSGKNKFAGFNYYELADFIPNVNAIFDELKLFSIFNIKGEIATLTIINTENTNDTIVFESPIAQAEIKGSTPIQCLGGIHTYMKRYLYLNALEIVESDLFDSKVGDKKDPLVEGQPELTLKANYKQLLINYCNENDLDMTEIAKKYKLNTKSSDEEFKSVLETLKIEQIEQIFPKEEV